MVHLGGVKFSTGTLTKGPGFEESGFRKKLIWYPTDIRLNSKAICPNWNLNTNRKELKMEITHRVENEIMIIAIKGRLDAATAPIADKTIKKRLKEPI